LFAQLVYEKYLRNNPNSNIKEVSNKHKEVKLIGVEAGGLGLHTQFHAARFAVGKKGILQGMKSYVISDDDGNIAPVHSISAGLDYPGVGPEHAYLNDIKRAQYTAITDDEAVNAFYKLTRIAD